MGRRGNSSAGQRGGQRGEARVPRSAFRIPHPGQALVEFALALPVLLLLLIGTLEVGRALYFQSRLALAAGQAARQGALTGDAGQMRKALAAALPQIPPDQLHVTLCSGEAGFAAVRLSYDMPLAIPFISASVPLRADAAQVAEGASGHRAYPVCGEP